MADVPANQKLWDMLVVQARAKFAKWPSLPASRWVHQQYAQKGGKFISEAEVARIKKAREAASGKKKKDAK